MTRGKTSVMENRLTNNDNVLLLWRLHVPFLAKHLGKRATTRVSSSLFANAPPPTLLKI